MGGVYLRKIISIAIALLLLVCAVIVYYVSCHQSDIYLSGSSENWKVYISMVKPGITDVVIAPAKEFSYPSLINIELEDSNGNIYTEKLQIRQGNSYNVKFPTNKLFYKNADGLKCTINYRDFSETIILSTIIKGV